MSGRGQTPKGHFIGMAITELLSVVAALLQWGSKLQHSLVLIITDNQNVLRWIRKRGAKNLYAQALLRLITRLEIRGEYQVWTEDIRSKDNHVPDCLSRLRTRDGDIDVEESKRWESLMTQVDKRIEISDAGFCFPESWFSSRDPSKWSLAVPGETWPESGRSSDKRDAPPVVSSAPSGANISSRAGGRGGSFFPNPPFKCGALPEAAVGAPGDATELLFSRYRTQYRCWKTTY